MTVSIEERLIVLEHDLNRIMDKLTEAATSSDGQQYLENHEEKMEALVERCVRLEEAIVALQQKHKIASREQVSESAT